MHYNPCYIYLVTCIDVTLWMSDMVYFILIPYGTIKRCFTFYAGVDTFCLLFALRYHCMSYLLISIRVVFYYFGGRIVQYFVFLFPFGESLV